MKLLVTRHGQTDWNIEEKIQGATDNFLNDEGIKQAEQARELVKNTDIDLIICSTLTRAKQTAEIINEGRNIKIIYDSRIAERNYGEYEGKRTAEVDFSELFKYYKNKPCKNGESIQEFFDRIYNFLDDLKQNYNNYNRILLVAHGDVSRAINSYFNGIPKNGNVKDLMINNCEFVEYEFDM